MIELLLIDPFPMVILLMWMIVIYMGVCRMVEKWYERKEKAPSEARDRHYLSGS